MSKVTMGKDAIDLNNLPVVHIQDKDNKWHECKPFMTMVKGGKAVIYPAADGAEIKREPLARYLARVEREKAREAKESSKEK